MRRGDEEALQCGHGASAVENLRVRLRRDSPCWRFNAATARAPWRTRHRFLLRSGILELQCGHGASAVENLVCTTSAILIPMASMRPRRERRGEPLFRRRLAIPALLLPRCFNAATARAP